MVLCPDCRKEMSDESTETCTITLININGFSIQRDTEYYDINERCHDCGIKNGRGNTHHYGCDIERCPECGGQLISCDCKKKLSKPLFSITKINTSPECRNCNKEIKKGEPRLRYYHKQGQYTVSKSLCILCLIRLIVEFNKEYNETLGFDKIF